MRTAIIFDFDGTILDTETPEFAAWQEVYASYGASLDQAVYSQVIGTTDATWSPLAHLGSVLGRPLDPEAVAAAQRDHFERLIAAESPRPGVIDWLDEARDLSLRIGLASSSSAAWVSRFLTQLGLTDRFAAVATRERVARSKPDPALYELALHDLGVPAADALAVEDSPNGIAAAKGAGLYCVAVPNPMTAAFPLDADLQLPSLRDRRLSDVLSAA
ncbi:HAD-IA family hydrolase [Actinoplanes sp. NPDC051411]|uniref:HAD family hydrolase n=1 Tax=Actinoplanes sp. NPDC051411 TaxID=3155522 RepID=UPI003437C386